MFGQYYGHMAGIGLGFGWIFMLIVWVLVIGVIVFLVRGVSGHGCGHLRDEKKPREKTAVDILKERYAKGEISKDDFEKMKKDVE
jgi:putative membrane protein